MPSVNIDALTELADYDQDLTELLRPLVAKALTNTEAMISALANAELSEETARELQAEINYIADDLEHTLPPKTNEYEVEGQLYDLDRTLSIRAEQKEIR